MHRFLRKVVFSLFTIHSLFYNLVKALETWKHSENDRTINYLQYWEQSCQHLGYY